MSQNHARPQLVPLVQNLNRWKEGAQIRVGKGFYDALPFAIEELAIAKGKQVHGQKVQEPEEEPIKFWHLRIRRRCR